MGKPFPRFTPGDVVLFRAYWWRLFGPVQTLARVNDMVQRAVAAARRIFGVLDAPEGLPGATNAVTLDDVRGELELRNVSFAYDTDQPAQRDTAQANGNGQPTSF